MNKYILKFTCKNTMEVDYRTGMYTYSSCRSEAKQFNKLEMDSDEITDLDDPDYFVEIEVY